MRSVKGQKRARKTAREYEDQMGYLAAERETQAQLNEALFTIDRSGSKAAKKVVEKVLAPQAKGTFESATEKKLIARISTTEKKQPYAKLLTATGSNEVRDLWDEPVVTKGKSKAAPTDVSSSAKRLKVAVPGQSYNPSSTDHQDALAQAVALQIKKDEAHLMISKSTIEMAERTKRGAMSSITDVEMQEESDDESDDEEDNEGEESGNEDGEDGTSSKKTSRSALKKKERFTRAQRNKIRNRNINSSEQAKAIAEKELLKSIGKLSKIVEDIEAKDSSSQDTISKKKAKAAAAEAAKQAALTALDAHDIGSVPLSDELQAGGGLRTVIPKGVSLFDRQANMRSAGDLNVPDKRGRRAHEKPHGPRRIAWHAKHKYV
jgi:hypothetical protein